MTDKTAYNLHTLGLPGQWGGRGVAINQTFNDINCGKSYKAYRA